MHVPCCRANAHITSSSLPSSLPVSFWPPRLLYLLLEGFPAQAKMQMLHRKMGVYELTSDMARAKLSNPLAFIIYLKACRDSTFPLLNWFALLARSNTSAVYASGFPPSSIYLQFKYPACRAVEDTSCIHRITSKAEAVLCQRNVR